MTGERCERSAGSPKASERLRSVFLSLPVALMAAAIAVYLVAINVAPDAVRRLIEHEGPIEHVGHLVFLAAVTLWGGVAWRAMRPRNGRELRRGTRLLAVGAASYLCLMLLEDLDWGAVYRLELGHSVVEGITGGTPNFHNAQASHSGLLGWALTWIMAPWVLFFGVGLLPAFRAQQTFAPVVPTWVESVQFVLLSVCTLLMDSVELSGNSSAALSPTNPLGYFQIVNFAFWGLVAWRVHRDLATLPSAATESATP